MLAVIKGLSKVENQNTVKPAILSSCLALIILSLAGLSALFFGFIYLVGAANADPTSNLDAKTAILLRGQTVAILTFLYLVICLVSPFFWYNRGRSWNYVILGLGLIHLVGSTYLAISPNWESDLTRLYLYSSAIMNLILVAVMILDRKRFGVATKKKNTYR